MTIQYADSSFFFFNDTATTEIYTLSYTTLFRSERDRREAHGEHVVRPHTEADERHEQLGERDERERDHPTAREGGDDRDRKSTRLTSSHLVISYAVFCLQKKNVIDASCV